MDKTEHNFYRIVFTNNEEKFIITDLYDKTEKLIKVLDDQLMGSKFFKLRQTNTQRERNPIYHSKDTIFTIEKVHDGMISTNHKLWEVL